MPDGTVSIIIPAYNAALTIAETLRSALAQTHVDHEILVVDDASQDDTPSIVTDMAVSHARLRLIRLRENRGVSGARNVGIRAARGRYVAPLDADDLWRSDKLARQLGRFERAPGVGAVYTWWTYIDAAGNIIPGRYGAFLYEGDIYARMLMANFSATSSVPMFRRDFLDQVGHYDESLRTHEDKALQLAVTEVADFAVVPHCLVGYRSVPGSLSSDLESLFAADSRVHAHARRSHPELPGWLFRWATANFLWWVAFQHVGAGRRRAAVATAGRVFCTDPGFILRPTAYRSFRGLWRAIRGRARSSRTLAGAPFLGTDALALQPTRPDGMFERWRDRRLARVRIRRRGLLLNRSAPLSGTAAG